MRTPSIEGDYYPKSETGLRKALEDCFNGERGPGSLPPEKNAPLSAIIVPHDKLALSGQCAAWAYHAVPKDIDLFIILAPNLTNEEAGHTDETWKTPLGELRAEQHFLRKLAELGSINKCDAEQPAIEAQLPFIQFIAKQEAKIAPLLITHDLDLHQLALDLKETIMDSNKKVLFIVCSDFTRHGREQGQLRFTQNPQEQIYEFDKQLIEVIGQGNPTAFASFAEQNLTNMSGVAPVELLLHLLKPFTLELAQYYTSGDLSDYKNSVSYAALLIKEK